VHEQRWFYFIKLKNEGFSWFFSWLFCEFDGTPCESQCYPCSNAFKCGQCFDILFDCEMFESFQNFLLGSIGCFTMFCLILPIGIWTLVFLASIALQLICYCPPLAILTSALPCLRAKDYGVYSFFEKAPQTRADPSVQGHVNVWHEIGWVRAFFLCCVLTCFGFFPGVIFAAFVAGFHLFRNWSY
jgi:hypothetical protein